MTQTQFVQQLNAVKNSYKWMYLNNQLIGIAKYGKKRGSYYNPITALARTLKLCDSSVSESGTLFAASKLGVSEELTKAMLSDSNRGHAQIIRGQMLKILS
jgi:hypothetical protein